MATIIPFPQQHQHVYSTTVCAGCHQPLPDDYWELTLPPTTGLIVEHLALCDPCNDELMKHGVVL